MTVQEISLWMDEHEFESIAVFAVLCLMAFLLVPGRKRKDDE